MVEGRNSIAFAPRLGPSVSPRLRLQERLDDLDAHPLVILRAAAGGGKSTALAAWASRADRPGVWVTLGPADGGRLAFWRRLVTTILDTGAAPAGGILGDLVLSGEIAEQLPSALLRAFADLPDRFLIVIDDYHVVADDQVHDDLQRLLEAGAHVDFRLATRAATPFERADRLARLDARVIGPTELAFDRAETRSAAVSAGLDEPSADSLHDTFGGWPLAIQTTLVEREAHPAASATDVLERVLTLGLPELLVDAVDSDYLTFLLRTSLPARFTAELAAALGGSRSAELLERAEFDGFGTWLDDGARTEFAYQPHLRRHLLGELRRRLPAELDGLRSSYGHELLRQRDGFGAMQQFAAIGDWDAVTRAVRTHYADLIQSHPAKLPELLREIPPATLRRQPILLALSAITEYARPGITRSRLQHLASLAVALLQARLGMGEAVDRVVLLLALLGTQRISGQYEQSVATAERLISTASALGEEQWRELAGVAPRLWPHVATTMLYDGQLRRAALLGEVGERAASDLDRPWSDVHANGLRLFALAELGDRRELTPLLERAASRSRPYGWRGTYPAAGYHFAEALEALERFDGERARAEVDALAPHESTIEHWPIIARIRALGSLTEGDAFAGLARLDRDVADHDDRPATSRTMVAALAGTRADLLLAIGEPMRARADMRRLRRGPESTLPASRVALALGKTEPAIALASEIAWAADCGPRPKAEAFLLLAVGASRVGRTKEAREAATRAVELLEMDGLRRPLMMVPRADLEPLLHDIGAAALLVGVPRAFPDAAPVDLLTPAERRVLAVLQGSARTEDLAAQLYLSANTVKVHLRNVYRKLGVSSRDEALSVGHLRGLLDPDDPE